MKHNFLLKFAKVAAVPVFLASLAFVPQNSIVNSIANNVDIFAYDESNDYYGLTQESDGNWTLTLKKLKSDYELSSNDVNLSDAMINTQGDERKITKINVEEGVVFSNYLPRLFAGLKDCKEIDLKGSVFNEIEITNMLCMFSGCSSLEKIDMTPFENVKPGDMSFIFAGCKSLKSVDLSCIKDISNVTDTQNMFASCESLKYVNMSNFSGVSIVNRQISYMFAGCKSLKSINLANISTIDFSEGDMPVTKIFLGCISLENVILGSSQLIDYLPNDTEVFNDVDTGESTNYKKIKVFTNASYSGDLGSKTIVKLIKDTDSKIDDDTNKYRSYCFDRNGDVYLIYHTNDLTPDSIDVRYIGPDNENANVKYNTVINTKKNNEPAEAFTEVYESIVFQDGSELKPTMEGEYLIAIKLSGANALEPINIGFHENKTEEVAE